MDSLDGRLLRSFSFGSLPAKDGGFDIFEDGRRFAHRDTAVDALDAIAMRAMAKLIVLQEAEAWVPESFGVVDRFNKPPTFLANWHPSNKYEAIRAAKRQNGKLKPLKDGKPRYVPVQRFDDGTFEEIR